MKRRSLFLSLAVAVLTWGSGALEAHAGLVPIPTTLDQLLVPGALTTATNSVESGITLSVAFFAPAGTIIDYKFGYVVSAPPGGSSITGALLSASLGVNGGTGSVIITELFTPLGGGPATGIEVSTGGAPSVMTPLPASQSFLVQIDLLIFGGNNGATAGSINQAFASTNETETFSNFTFSSSTIPPTTPTLTAGQITVGQFGTSGVVPEPSSIALLGIGMTGFMAFRRLFKRHAVA